MINETEKFAAWAIIELFGHNQIAGMCTEQNIAGTNMLRVDVPETTEHPPFTRFLGSGAIYAINPVTEEIAKHWAESLQVSPVHAWDIRQFMEKNKLALNKGEEDLPI
jgi:hypothetical protein